LLTTVVARASISCFTAVRMLEDIGEVCDVCALLT